MIPEIKLKLKNERGTQMIGKIARLITVIGKALGIVAEFIIVISSIRKAKKKKEEGSSFMCQ